MQTALLVAEGAAEHSARLRASRRRRSPSSRPLVADQALVGEYAAIEPAAQEPGQDAARSTASPGPTRTASASSRRTCPTSSTRRAGSRASRPSSTSEQSIEVTAGGVGYGTLTADMTPVKAHNRLWQQFVKQLQIVAVTLFLMLQFIWLIFRGNLGTLRMLAEGANRFSQGDHAVRIDAEGAPEVAARRRGVQQHGEQHREPDRLARQERIEEQAARDDRRAVERGDLDHATCAATSPAGTPAPPRCSAIRRRRSSATR